MSGRCQAGCQTDVRQMPGRCLADARQMPGRCQADVRQMPGTCQADARQMPDARQMSGRCQADYAIMPGRYQVDVRPLNWPRRESRSVCNYNYIHIQFRVDSLFHIPRQWKSWVMGASMYSCGSHRRKLLNQAPLSLQNSPIECNRRIGGPKHK